MEVSYAKKVFYGWFIVFSTVLLNAMGSGVTSVLAVFLSPIAKTIGYTQTQVSAIVSFYMLGVLIGSLLLSKFIGKANLRALVFIFGILEGISIFVMSLSSKLSVLYIAGLMIGFVAVAVSLITVPLLITNWFKVKKGLALGIATAGISLGSALFAPIVSMVIGSRGYENAFKVYALMVIIMAIIVGSIVRTSPEEKGMLPYGLNQGDPTIPDIEQNAKFGEDVGMTLGQAIKSAKYWLLLLFVGFYFVAQTSIPLQTPSYLRHIGFSTAKVSLFLFAFGIFAMIGKVVIGHILDKYGLLNGGLIALVMILIATLSLIGAKTIPQLSILYIVFGGGGLMMSMIAMPIYVSKFFGTKAYSVILASLTIISTIIAIGASVLSGYIIDKSGYASMYMFTIIIMTLGTVASIVALKMDKSKED